MNNELLTSIENPVIYVPIRHLYNCREASTNQLFIMQNEPNLLDAQMNVNKVLTREYENIANWTLGENEPKRTQLKPIKANFKPKTDPIKPNFTPIASTPASTFCCGRSYQDYYVV